MEDQEKLSTMENIEESDDYLVENHKFLSHAKIHDDFDDFGLRFNSKRGDFAQRHLFKCGLKEEDILEVEEESSHGSHSSISDNDVDSDSQSSIDADSNHATDEISYE